MSFLSNLPFYNYFYPSAPAENTNTASSPVEAVVHQASRAALEGLGNSRTMPVASNGVRYASWANAVRGAKMAEGSAVESLPASLPSRSEVMESATEAHESGFILVDSSSIPH